MTASADMKMTVTFDPTPEGFEAAREMLDAYEERLPEAAPSAAPPQAAAGSGIYPPLEDSEIPRAVYEAAWDEGLTRPFMKLLPREEDGGLTMAELGAQLKAYWDDDRPLTPAETRAVHRNLKKIERTFKRRGQMPEDRTVVHQDWSLSEGVGRYYVSAADHAAIQAL